MRVYCKCLNVEATIFAPETKARPWSSAVVEDENDDLPQNIDHESFQGDVFHFTAKTANELIVHQDDIISRRRRMQEEVEDNHSTFVIHAYLPRLIVTHRRLQWHIRECFLCRTTVMAYLHRGLSVVCPDGLHGTSCEDNLPSVLNGGSARLWMFSRDALSCPRAPLVNSVLQSLGARQQLESMTQVWRVAQSRAQAELEQRLEALRRQELAAFEEQIRLAKEMQHQVANAYYSMLSVLQSEPDAFVEAEEEEKAKKRKAEQEEEEEKARRKEEAKNAVDYSRVEGLRNERSPLTHPSGDTDRAVPRSLGTIDDVEVATEALDLYEADLFDDGPRSARAHGDNDDDSYVSDVSAEERESEDRKRVKEKVDGEESEDDEEALVENLSTSAISTSIQARAGMRASVRTRTGHRLPDMDAFNQMTDAERTYAIEKASYQMQDNRLHEIYGDTEPPFLEELRRQAERARLNPAPPLEEEVTTAQHGSPF